ncbi:MAG: molecular chaperone TorD family protein [Acidimicrobiia bacterium]|nr:molecular chaperone TorD family protein [Acidimicrobiia bacterium]
MFVYSLSGLELKDSGDQGPVEIEENETTARSATYQVLGRLFGEPDADHYEMARSGQWAKELATAGELLTFTFEPGDAAIPDDMGPDEYAAAFAHVLGGERAGAPVLCAAAWVEDAAHNHDEVVRFYEYFGLQAAGTERPVDHLVTECDFMQYITFREAAAPSPRLGKSYRRAQLDFHDRQFSLWVPELAAHVKDAATVDFFAWAAGVLADFTAADREHVAGLLGA